MKAAKHKTNKNLNVSEGLMGCSSSMERPATKTFPIDGNF